MPLPCLRIALVGDLTNVIFAYQTLLSKSSTERGFHITITAICTSNNQRAHNQLGNNKEIQLHSTLQDCLNDTTIDVIHFNLPIEQLIDAIPQAISAGKAVLSNTLASHHLHPLQINLSSHLHCVVESWAYKPGIIELNEMINNGALVPCTYNLDISMSVSKDIWQNNAVSSLPLIRGLRFLFGEISSVEYDASTKRTTLRHQNHYDKVLQGTIRIETVPRDQRKTNANTLKLQDNTGKTVIWNIEKNKITIQPSTSPEEEEEQQQQQQQTIPVKGDSWTRGGYKEAVLDALRQIHTLLHTDPTVKGNNAKTNKHDHSGRPEHRCTVLESTRDGKYSKRRRSNVAVIIVRIVFIISFLF